jgi:hypothetical protein
MRKITTVILLLLSVFAIGLNAPVVSTIVEDIVGGVTVISNSIYATTTDENNLTIDISVNNPNYPGYGEGLSPSSTYRFDDALVFENNVSKTGMEVVCVQIQSNDESLKFYTEDTIPSDIVSITLRENESKSVGIEINATSILGLNEGKYTIYVYSGECQ